MKILVTGGAGFIGSNVVDGYIEQGHEVVVVDNLYSGNRDNLNPKAHFYLMDITMGLLDGVFDKERPDIVNHHAAQISVPESVANPVFDANVNVLGFVNLLQCCVKYGVQKLIFISSGGAIYGEAGKIPTPENYPAVPLSPYAITKLTSETYLNFYNHQYGLNYTVLRYANVYGPRQVPHGEAGVVSIFMNKLQNGELPTIYHYPDSDDGMTRDYCYVKDIVKANVYALTNGNKEALNIGTGCETSTGTLYRTVLECFRQKGYALDSKFDKPTKGLARAGDLTRSCLDFTKARDMLGWQPSYDIKMGIEETALYHLT
ncbi:MAG: NAD-dependent epimerase/dehydratase family protein [Candidatus Magnetoovum sp. WYHC-5]|nr:NAD-dependent epimerase/dehydratase family protein [Candidatus Magnetoovum sp. WYHC-5]